MKHGLKLERWRIPSAFVQDNEYVLDDDDESEKEDEDKGNAENEEVWNFDSFWLTYCNWVRFI